MWEIHTKVYFFLLFSNSSNFDIENDLMVKNAKGSYRRSQFLPKKLCRGAVVTPKTISKWFCSSKLIGLKTAKKRSILWKSVWKSVKLYGHCMCSLHPATRSATFQNCGLSGFSFSTQIWHFCTELTSRVLKSFKKSCLQWDLNSQQQPSLD